MELTLLKKSVSNIINSTIEKFIYLISQLLTTMIIIRTVNIESYGAIGIIASYYSFVLILNISAESVLFKNYSNIKNKNELVCHYLVFNLIKSLLIGLISIIIFFILFKSETLYIYPLLSIFIVSTIEAIVLPFIILCSLTFEQRLVTYINSLRALINLTLSCGLFFIPTLEYIFYKDIFVCIFFLSSWMYVAKYKLSFTFNYKTIRKFQLKLILESIKDYSLWVHLNGVFTNIIYRSDALFLSLFTGVATVGRYNIALNSANIANILPGILAYQNKVAITNAKSKHFEYKISNFFVRLSTYVGILTIVFFYLVGKEYIYLISGLKNINDIYFLMMVIVFSLVIIKSMASPFMAYVAVKLSVKDMFIKVTLPSGIFAMGIFYFSAMLYGTIGLAIANVLVSMIWLLLLLSFMWKNEYFFSNIFTFEEEKEIIKKIIYREKKHE